MKHHETIARIVRFDVVIMELEIVNIELMLKKKKRYDNRRIPRQYKRHI
jgi:hypothetical protein